MDIEDLEEDYAVRQVVAINSAPRDFHISIDGPFDCHLFQHPCRHVRVLGSDAATKEVKTLLKLMLERFANAVLFIRDLGPALDAMTPEFLVKADLTADYTADCMVFVAHL